jgi:hypothetical protein
MEIESIGFLGIPTDRIDEMATIVERVLGLTPGRRDPAWRTFRVPTGRREFVELFRPGGYDERLLPAAATGPTVAFNVRDLVAGGAAAPRSGGRRPRGLTQRRGVRSSISQAWSRTCHATRRAA